MSSDPDPAAPAPGASTASAAFSRAMLALILGQISLHACMTGVRMAAPLQALRQGHSAWAVGVLLALFALAPIVLALPAGRMTDRHGYHRPLRIAVALSFAGAVVATVSGHYLAMCLAATLTGAGANVGLIAIQRRAGLMAGSSIERIRIFSWLGLAPALSNVLGPVGAGLLIDLAGFRAAFAALMVMPLAALLAAQAVPREAARTAAAGAEAGSAGAQRSSTRSRSLELLRLPALRRLLLVNWLLSASWDVHAFVLPVLGHQRGLAASVIGIVLGSFAAAVAAVRLLIPLLAHRLSEARVLAGAMLGAAAVFALYPLTRAPWAMGSCAIALGLALGAVQPMVMSKLHQITPEARHGEAIALRSIAINLSSSLMPLLFGLVGAAFGAASLFWLMGLAVGSGSLAARRL